MLKVFTRIAAFALTFGVSVSLVGLLFGFSASSKTSVRTFVDRRVSVEIQDFLEKDANNGRTRDYRMRSRYCHRRASGLAEYSRDVDLYVSDSSSMDDGFMPADLQYAWRDHMKAWKAERDLLNRRLDGDVSGDEFPLAYKSTSNAINDTWFQVLRIAERYGVDTRDLK